MKFLGGAICTLSVWVVFNSFLGSASIWEDILFGVIAAILAAVVVLRGE